MTVGVGLEVAVGARVNTKVVLEVEMAWLLPKDNLSIRRERPETAKHASKARRVSP